MIPALILSGVLDRYIGQDVGFVTRLVGDGMTVVGAAAPPGADLLVVALLLLLIQALRRRGK